MSTGLVALVGEWLPIVAAAGLLAHLTLLGLRPALNERVFLEERRERIEAETAELDDRLDALERLETALEDPIYRERLRWQWRLAGRAVHADAGGDGAAGELGPAAAAGPAPAAQLPPLAPRPGAADGSTARSVDAAASGADAPGADAPGADAPSATER